MGCDIHTYIEYSKDGERWDSWGKIELGRDYILFGLMAGVRQEVLGGGPPFPPRGLPDHLSWRVWYDYKEHQQDHHTPSWLTSKELGVIIKKYRKFVQYPHTVKLEATKTALDVLGKSGYSRLVFWFDS